MRPGAFPQCVVLCGLRDVRDYRIRSTSSPFNIVAESLRLGDFTREETLALLGQHTRETGQAFTDDAREAIWTQTLGQPWLVNALAYETCFKSKAKRDRSRPITADDIAEARGRSHRAPGDASRSVGGQARGGAGAPGGRADAERGGRAGFLPPGHRVRAGPRADCPGQAGAYRQPHLRRGPAARVGMGPAGDAGPEHDVVRGRGRQPEPGQADGGVSRTSSAGTRSTGRTGSCTRRRGRRSCCRRTCTGW